MKNKLLGKIFGERGPVQYNFTGLLDNVKTIRNHSESFCIIPQPTEGNWLGINTASRQLFPDCAFEIPQYFSNQVLTDEEIRQLVAHIEQLNFRNVVFSGFPPYFEKIIRAFNSSYASNLSVILHGTFTEMGHSDAAAHSMVAPVMLHTGGKIGKLAAVRKSTAEFITAYWQVPVFELANKCSIPGINVQAAAVKQRVNIGVLGANTFNKNLHNQVAAALLINGAAVHVSKGVGFGYLNSSSIVEHDRLNREGFITLLSQMHVNLHLSFSESWGQVAAESMLCGVPCLVSPNTNLLDGDEFLKEALTVNRTDAPLEIAEQVKRVLVNREEISKIGQDYIQQLNSRADDLLNKFLQA